VGNCKGVYFVHSACALDCHMMLVFRETDA